MKKNNATKLFFIFALIMVLTACSSAYQYQTLTTGISSKDVASLMYKDASNSKEEEGNTFLTYEECPYLGTEGTATYCLSNDSLQFSKWETSKENVEEAKKVYDSICSEKEKTYGAGEVLMNENNAFMTNWNTNGVSISVSCLKNGNTTMVSLLEIINPTTNDADN